MWRIVDAWDWFWYYRKGKVRFHVFDYGDTYNAFASNGTITVSNCFGGTPEAAKEMALFRLKEDLNREPKEREVFFQNSNLTVYRDK
ncbi:hypothetical protein [Neobacillus drentensis]|uniref:hypothetical protein n=1 Tax=Neobacillus drentensis TaxID=220684 RepID=UPI002FFEBEA4